MQYLWACKCVGLPMYVCICVSLFFWELVGLCCPLECLILVTWAQPTHAFTFGKYRCEANELCARLPACTLACAAVSTPGLNSRNFSPQPLNCILQRQKAHCVHISEINRPSLCAIRNDQENWVYKKMPVCIRRAGINELPLNMEDLEAILLWGSSKSY